jgi:hypothetical protein
MAQYWAGGAAGQPSLYPTNAASPHSYPTYGHGLAPPPAPAAAAGRSPSPRFGDEKRSSTAPAASFPPLKMCCTMYYQEALPFTSADAFEAAFARAFGVSVGPSSFVVYVFPPPHPRREVLLNFLRSVSGQYFLLCVSASSPPMNDTFPAEYLLGPHQPALPQAIVYFLRGREDIFTHGDSCFSRKKEYFTRCLSSSFSVPHQQQQLPPPIPPPPIPPPPIPTPRADPLVSELLAQVDALKQALEDSDAYWRRVVDQRSRVIAENESELQDKEDQIVLLKEQLERLNAAASSSSSSSSPSAPAPSVANLLRDSVVSETRTLSSLRQYALDPKKLTSDSMLGSGGDGVVYKANLSFAVKRFFNGQTQLKNDDGNFHRELRIPLQCCHPNIVNVIGYGLVKDDPDLYILSSLKDFSMEKILLPKVYPIFKESHLADMLVQMMRGLKYLHDRRIGHADLKLQNVLVEETRDGLALFLTDFGRAEEFQNVSKIDQTMGNAAITTLAYSAPETMRGRRGLLSDIYSMGLIARELFVGKVASLGKGFSISVNIQDQDKLDALVKEFPPAHPIVPFMKKCLQVDPRNRFNAAEALDYCEGIQNAIGLPIYPLSIPPLPPKKPSSQKPPSQSFLELAKTKPLCAYLMSLEEREEIPSVNIDP